MDFDSYSEWNTFTTRVSFPTAKEPPRLPRVGDSGELDAHVASPTASPNLTRVKISAFEVVKELEEGTIGAKYVICWKATGYPTWSLRPERVQEVEILEQAEDGTDRCEFRSWETMAGPLSSVVKRVVGAGLDNAFERMAIDLKNWAEGGMDKSTKLSNDN